MSLGEKTKKKKKPQNKQINKTKKNPDDLVVVEHKREEVKFYALWYVQIGRKISCPIL